MAFDDLPKHPREQRVTLAKVDIGEAILEAIEKYNLTDYEVLQILTGEALGYIRMGLRMERHGDYDKFEDLLNG